MRAIARSIACLVLSLSMAPTALAAGQAESEAARRYELGRNAFEAGRFTEAALQFQAALDAVPHAVAAVMVADAWERAGRLDRAADAWVIVPGTPGVTAEQLAQAQERGAALERLVGTLIVTSTGPARVQLDGEVARPTPARLHGETGSRTLIAVLGNAEQRRVIQLSSGRVLEVHLVATASRTLAPTEASDPVPAEAKRWWTTPRVLGASLIGAGVASLAVGVAFGISATRTKDEFDRAPSPALRDRGLAQVRFTNVGLLAGGLLTLGGTACLVLAPTPESSPTGAVVAGRTTRQGFALRLAGTF